MHAAKRKQEIASAQTNAAKQASAAAQEQERKYLLAMNQLNRAEENHANHITILTDSHSQQVAELTGQLEDITPKPPKIKTRKHVAADGIHRYRVLKTNFPDLHISMTSIPHDLHLLIPQRTGPLTLIRPSPIQPSPSLPSLT